MRTDKQILLTRLNFESFVIHFGRAINRSGKAGRDWILVDCLGNSLPARELFPFLLSLSLSFLFPQLFAAIVCCTSSVASAAQAVAKVPPIHSLVVVLAHVVVVVVVAHVFVVLVAVVVL